MLSSRMRLLDREAWVILQVRFHKTTTNHSSLGEDMCLVEALFTLALDVSMGFPVQSGRRAC